ncbi:conserved hypothetical protein [Borreliella garinii Far04]|nr:conserved hypothetical protein [Borreliella garinii Far04]
MQIKNTLNFFLVDGSFGNQKLYPKKILSIVATISYYLD